MYSFPGQVQSVLLGISLPSPRWPFFKGITAMKIIL